MLGHSRSASRQDVVSKPSADGRRVTRSQSREVEDSRGGSHETNPSALTAVAEESSVRTPQKSVSHYTSSRYGSSVIPESPEDAANISGTTILPSEPETDLDPEMMLEALPDLERAGKSLLDFLAPRTANPVTVVNKAKQLSDPSNTQSRRLRYLMSNLASEFKYFGNKTYLDPEGINRAFTTALAGRRGSFQDWGPEPIVHIANCARFAHEILLAGTSTNSRRQAIRNIENVFPLPFMASLVVEGQHKNPGESSLEKETFDLALEIRTQSLILLLEDRQFDPEFSPKNALRRCFFTGSSRKSPLRGFNLPTLGGANGTLPGEYKDAVQDRYNEILLSEVEDGVIDVEELKGAYRWQRFVLRAAQWIRKRTEEIRIDLENRMTAQEVHDAFFTSKHPSFASTLGGTEAEASGEMEEIEHGTTQNESAKQEGSVLLGQQQRQKQPESRPGRSDTERRRSSKPSYLNSASVQRIIQRQERLRSESEASRNRRQSEIVRPVSQTIEEHRTNRRQTTTALPSSRATQQDARQEIPASPEASPTLLPEETDITIADDFHLNIGDKETQLERSHSPPTIPRSTAPARLEVTSNPRRLSENIWAAVKGGMLTQPAPQPARAPGRSARFIDRQQHAERVSPISQHSSQSAVRRVEARVRKRPRAVSETESTDEDLFVYDDRTLDIDRRRAEKPQQPGSKRRRVEEESGREHTNPDARAIANADDDGDDDLYEGSRQAHSTRRSTLVSYQPTRKRSTSRVYWTEAEDNRLLRLMREHGTRWASIVRQNEAQPVREDEVRIEGRDQVQFKDRARNIKIKYYREGLPVPRYFENVTMKKRDYEKLEKMGIAVSRP
ncbi:SANT/Myb-like DNA-binding domain-containing protein [Aspergillus lucknowensis]|uniref:Myb-like domain-containing protein n=1 Tax=Aspergillus lucknowensis TaxID=176173 RepID=A0ABR4LR94_9EURO